LVLHVSLLAVADSWSARRMKLDQLGLSQEDPEMTRWIKNPSDQIPFFEIGEGRSGQCQLTHRHQARIMGFSR
jgi:hypothetical protein